MTLRRFHHATSEDAADPQPGRTADGWFADPKTGLWTFDTRFVGRGRGFDLWRDFNDGAGSPTILRPFGNHDVGGHISIIASPGYATSDVSVTPQMFVREAQQIRRGHEDMVLVLLMIGGGSVAEQAGRSVTALPGDIMVIFMDVPFRVVHKTAGSFRGSRLPASDFPPGLRDRSPLLLSPHSSPLAAIAAGHLQWHPPDHASLLSFGDVVKEQLVALLSRGLDMPGWTARSGPRLAEAARSMIEAEIANPNLSAKLLCSRLGVSRTTLFEALAANGDTLGNLVRERRLAGCRDEMMLASGTETLAAISERWGFRDQSTFTRAFSRRFGRPPTQWTRAMRDMGSGPLVRDEP